MVRQERENLIKQYEKRKNNKMKMKWDWNVNRGYKKRGENEKKKYEIRSDELRRKRIYEMGWGEVKQEKR